MSFEEKVLVVTPTWNEEESVEQHLRDIFRELPGISVLVVDDSSTDRTPAIVNALRSEFARLHLIERKGPRNFVRSYCEGLGWGVERGYEALVSMDADRSHPAEAIEALLEAGRDADLVVASRYLQGVSVRNWPLRRVLLSALANRYARFLTTVPCTDMTSGFCLYRASLLKDVLQNSLFSSGYAFQIEMKYRAWLAGATLREVAYTFVERRSGDSKLNWRRILEGTAAPLWCRLRVRRPRPARTPASNRTSR